jgi:hypothetical protein
MSMLRERIMIATLIFGKVLQIPARKQSECDLGLKKKSSDVLKIGPFVILT